MENASKALTMAGSVLFAIMIISVLVFGYGKLNETSEEREKSKIIEQIIEFNKEFESYNRKDVYGAELLSLINKIEDYNKKVTDADEGYRKITGTVKFASELGSNSAMVPTLHYTSGPEIQMDEIIEDLGNVNDALNRYDMNKKLDWYEKYLGLKTKYPDKAEEYYKEKFSNLSKDTLANYKAAADSVTDFKRRYFKCIKVEYDDETSVGKTGRIVRMEFEEIDTR